MRNVVSYKFGAKKYVLLDFVFCFCFEKKRFKKIFSTSLFPTFTLTRSGGQIQGKQKRDNKKEQKWTNLLEFRILRQKLDKNWTKHNSKCSNIQKKYK